jgi:D-arginine dehydrogenase
MDKSADVLVIGAGMAGASLAYELSPHARVIVLEREDQPGYHTTGRSAALYSETYGNATMRMLTRAGRRFFTTPPTGFAQAPLLTPRGTLLVGTPAQREALQRVHDDSAGEVGSLQLWSAEQVNHKVPVFGGLPLAGGVWEPEAMDIDVHALHQGYLRGLRARGGQVVCHAEVQALSCTQGQWTVQTRAGEFSAPLVVNAAGAWADELGAMAGSQSIGLQPLRRTAITFDAPAALDTAAWPAVIDVDEQFYFKPEAGRLLASPADETPSPPCDAQPDEYDIAVLVDRIETATTLRVPRIHSRWAGLRSFVADRTLVAGFDAQRSGFFWLAGQGGYGIQTASGASRAAAALVLARPLPSELQDLGLVAEHLSPLRLSTSA